MSKEHVLKSTFRNLVTIFVLFLVIIGINCLLCENSYPQTNNEDEIKLNRSLAFRNTSTQVPYIHFEIRDVKGNSVHCVAFPGFEVKSHGRVKENEMVIKVDDINAILKDLKYVIINKDVLAKSPFVKMNRDQLIREYFVKGAIKDKYVDLAQSREFIFCLLRNGLFVRSGCESSLELYIGRPDEIENQ
jgi:hypothetical protein